MKPKDLISKWVKLFNKNDADKISELYHLDALNHQVANEPINGKKTIKEMFEKEFNNANMTCLVD